MKNLILIAVCLLINISVFAQNGNDVLLGKWENKNQTHVIEFVKNNALFDAVILKSNNSSTVGKKQITGLKQAGMDNYTGGTLYLFKKNTTAVCSVRIVSDTQIEIKVNKGLMSKSEIWTRIK